MPIFLKLGFGHPGGAARALVQLLQRDEQRADHRRRFLAAHDLGEIALLDAQSGVERHQQALVNAFQDRGGGRVIAVGLPSQDGDGRRPQIGSGHGIDRAAGQLEALLVPRRYRLQAIPDHCLCGFDELGRFGDLVDQTHRPGFLG
jgi:hypothetical protein